MNKIIIKNVNLPPSIDEFSEEFANCHIVFLIDFFFEYDQIEPEKQNKNLTVFMTPIEFLKMISIFMKTTNSIAQFVRIVIKIFQNHIFHVILFFVDDVEMKKSKIDYNMKKSFLR